MKKYYFLMALLFVGLLQNPVKAEVPAGLRPVDANYKTQCVEYHLIDGKGYCRDKPIQNPSVPESASTHEQIAFQFDSRPWRIGFWNQKTRLFEYVVGNEQVTNWKELVGTQFFPGLQKRFTPEQLMQLTLGEMRRAGFKPKVSILAQKPGNILYEWVLTDTPAENQDELQRIFADDRGLYIIRYVSRPTMTAENRKVWTQLLLQATPK